MRRNLDQSEAAIIQVFEEKQRVWERQMDELRQNYASRLQQVTRCVMYLKFTKMHLVWFLLTDTRCRKLTCEKCFKQACNNKTSFFPHFI